MVLGGAYRLCKQKTPELGADRPEIRTLDGKLGRILTEGLRDDGVYEQRFESAISNLKGKEEGVEKRQ